MCKRTLLQVYICGGGVHNKLLMEVLSLHLNQEKSTKKVQLLTTSELGLSPDWVEAAAFAWMASCYCEDVEANLPEVTGAAKRARLGAMYKAN